MPLHRFGSAPNVYTFPVTLGDYRDNFASPVRRAIRLPGLSGGYDPFGQSVAPREIGEVRQSFTLVTRNRTGAGSMDTLRETARALVLRGTQPLYFRPTDFPTRAERWCMAAVNDVQMSQDIGEQTDIFQPVTVIWQVSDPRWYSPPSYASTALVWDVGVWDTNTWAWGTPTIFSGTGTTDVVRTQGGTAETQPDIVLRTGSSQTITNPIFRLFFDGLQIDELIWTGTMTENSMLWINCRTRQVTLNGVNVYSGLTWTSVDWMTLYPGANTLRVITPVGNSGSVEFGALDTWI